MKIRSEIWPNINNRLLWARHIRSSMNPNEWLRSAHTHARTINWPSTEIIRGLNTRPAMSFVFKSNSYSEWRAPTRGEYLIKFYEYLSKFVNSSSWWNTYCQISHFPAIFGSNFLFFLRIFAKIFTPDCVRLVHSREIIQITHFGRKLTQHSRQYECGGQTDHTECIWKWHENFFKWPLFLLNTVFRHAVI